MASLHSLLNPQVQLVVNMIIDHSIKRETIKTFEKIEWASTSIQFVCEKRANGVWFSVMIDDHVSKHRWIRGGNLREDKSLSTIDRRFVETNVYRVIKETLADNIGRYVSILSMIGEIYE